jgi:hypothetical protein
VQLYRAGNDGLRVADHVAKKRACPTDEERMSDEHRVVDKHSVVSIEERLAAWRELEQAASAAEHAIPQGQAAADPRLRDLHLRAMALRQQADQEFAAIARAIKMDDNHA